MPKPRRFSPSERPAGHREHQHRIPFERRKRERFEYQPMKSIPIAKRPGIVATQGGQRAGRITYRVENKRGGMRFLNVDIDVKPGFQRKGVATHLVRQIRNMCVVHNYFHPKSRIAFLEARVEESNYASRELMKSLGFDLAGNLRGGDYSEKKMLIYTLKVPNRI